MHTINPQSTIVITYATHFRNKKFHALHTQYVYDKSPKLNNSPVKRQTLTAATRRNNVLLLDCYTTQSHSLSTFFRTCCCLNFQGSREAASLPATQVMSTDCMASYSSDTIP